jgi:uncharacterized protein Yka (UPF0111/DUF47 family)
MTKKPFDREDIKALKELLANQIDERIKIWNVYIGIKYPDSQKMLFKNRREYLLRMRKEYRQSGGMYPFCPKDKETLKLDGKIKRMEKKLRDS